MELPVYVTRVAPHPPTTPPPTPFLPIPFLVMSTDITAACWVSTVWGAPEAMLFHHSVDSDSHHSSCQSHCVKLHSTV
jgi:hypothetical protein